MRFLNKGLPLERSPHRCTSLPIWLISSWLCAFSSHSLASDAAFQEALFTACSGATNGLAQRCAESNGGDLSPDSESSLSPLQVLSYNANALQETVAGVRAIREQNTNDALASTQFGRFSLALYSETTRLLHDQTPLEYGYRVDMDSIRISLDYRLDAQTFAALILSQGKSDTRFDHYSPESVFPIYNPDSAGSNESRSRGIGVVASHYINDFLYIDGLLLYTRSDFDYSREAVYQSANLGFDLPVITRGSSSGQQFAAAISGGIDHHWKANSITAYARLDFQRSNIDGYRERGGNGFALAVADISGEQLLSVIGTRLSHTINLDSLVIIPQAFAEFQQKTRSEISTATVTFINDGNQTPLHLRSGSADNRLHRLGLGIALIWPHGINGFANINRDYGEKNFKRHQFTAGVKLEF